MCHFLHLPLRPLGAQNWLFSGSAVKSPHGAHSPPAAVRSSFSQARCRQTPRSCLQLRYPQNEMGRFITSSGGSCLPGIRIPANGDAWPSFIHALAARRSIERPPFRQETLECPLRYRRLKERWKLARSAL